MCCLFFFFFFQAEDGIRDLTVTGVQTCALPIWPRPPGPTATESRRAGAARRRLRRRAAGGRRAAGAAPCAACRSGRPCPRSRSAARSEEHTSELQAQSNLVCRLLLEKKKRIVS